MNPAARITTGLAALGIDVQRVQAGALPGQYRVSGVVWHPMAVPGHSTDGPVDVAVPVAGIVQCNGQGAVDGSALVPPTVDDIDEVRHFVASLAAQGQIAGPGSAAGATHEVQRQPDGRLRLIRRVFTGR